MHRASGAHGKVVPFVSCHSDTPMWRYAKLPVLRKMYWKLLVNKLRIRWNIKILINLCEEGPWMLCAKFNVNFWKCLGGVVKSKFATFCDFATIQGMRKYKVMECAINYMGVISQNAFSLIIMPPSGGHSRQPGIITFFGKPLCVKKLLNYVFT